MFDCHAHPGSLATNALVCSASTDEKEKLFPFSFHSLGALPGYKGDVEEIRNWARNETFLGEVGLDKRFENKEKQISFLHSVLEVAEENRNIVTFHLVGWTDDFLSILRSHHLEGFIVHGFTSSLPVLSTIITMGGVVSLSPRAKNTKLMRTPIPSQYLDYILTESDMATGGEEVRKIDEWNTYLSNLFSLDMERKVEENISRYLLSKTLKNPQERAILSTFQ